MALDKNNAHSNRPTPIGAYYPVAATDWGVLPPGSTGTALSAGANLTDVGSGGSLAAVTTYFKLTWVTALGESTPSAEISVSVTGGGSGSVTVALASAGSGNVTTQLGAQPIIGWNIYSGTTTGTEKLNAAQSGLGGATLASQTVTNFGVTSTITYIPIATTSATVKVVGAGANQPVINTSGLNALVLPAIATATTANVDMWVPQAFIPQRTTFVTRPGSTAETSGIAFATSNCIAPLWAASTAFNAGDYITLNGWVFQCTTAGTTAAANAFPAAFATSVRGGTVTDNTATWTNRGKGSIVRVRYSNPTSGTLQPTAMEYDLSQ